LYSYNYIIPIFVGFIPDISQTICVGCPAGYYCPDPRQPPLLCANGTYSLSGLTIECSKCPIGYSCPQQDWPPQLCAVGSYSPVGATECMGCPAGATCVNQSLPNPCTSGEYSPLGGVYFIHVP